MWEQKKNSQCRALFVTPLFASFSLTEDNFEASMDSLNTQFIKGELFIT